MKKLIVIAALALAGTQAAQAQGPGLSGSEEGIGAGGSGGNPNATDARSLRVLPVPAEPGEDEAVVGTMRSFGQPPVSEDESIVAPFKKLAPPTRRDGTVLVNRAELLKAVDAALNSVDLEMEVDNKARTVRLKKFDLTRGILHGRVLETNKPIRLIDETKASGAETAPNP